MNFTTDEGHPKSIIPAGSITPAIDDGLQGAPYTPPGSASGTPVPGTKKMTGRPVQTAVIPPGFASEVAGAPVKNMQPQTPVSGSFPVSGTEKSGAAQPATQQEDERQLYDMPQESSDTDEEDDERGSLTIPDEFKGSSYDDVIEYLEGKLEENRPLTEEELRKLRKRQKAEGIVSGISDAVRSIANLIATHNYAPDMTTPNANMSSRAQARFDKDKAERQAQDDAYFNYAMNIARLRDADRNQGLQIWQLEHGLEREAKEDEYREAAELRAQAKADRDTAMAELRMKRMEGEISLQEAKAEEARIKAKYAGDLQRSIIGKNNRAGTGRSGGGGGGHKGGGGKSGGKGDSSTTWYATDDQGQVHTFAAKNGVHANNVAGGNGWNLISSTTTSTSTTGVGGKRTTTRTTKTNIPKKKKNKLGL